MEFLLDEANNEASGLMIWEYLAMMHTSDIENELHVRDTSRHPEFPLWRSMPVG